ncbi:(2Fe-2S)-binding protein [Myxococcota bacterium]|nr:(2Fe-2S)-binding protein [Myxococcota bacterium]
MDRVKLHVGGGQVISAPRGRILRDALLDAGVSPHNGAKALSCRGLGTCGTCAVELVGEVSPPTRLEEARLRFPPHTGGPGRLRLACQVQALGDLQISKREGFWGQGEGRVWGPEEGDSGGS